MKNSKMLAIVVLVLGLMVWPVEVSKAAPMGTAFTYQSRLMDANQPADGLYDFMFRLFDAPDGPGELGAQGIHDLDVIDGYFTVELDFGSDVFNGDARWLEIDVRPGDSNDADDFVTLSPRQEVTPAPYALQTRGIFVDDALNVGIGTTSPAAKLNVNGDALFHNIVDEDTSVDIRSGAADTYAALRLLNSSGTVNGIFGYDQENDTVHLVHDSTFGGSMKGIIIDNNGKVSIGSGGGQFFALLSVNNLPGVDPFNIGGSPTSIPLFIVKNSGKVGIGTNNPQGTLDVNGDIFQRGISLHADYVFESDYKVESIEEHSEFMWQEKHLSAIPKAKVDEAGKQIVEVGAHRRGIVEELEKAHIYIEQLHKRVKTLEEKLMKLEAGLNAVQ